jgi:small subunit ribosomal protein S3
VGQKVHPYIMRLGVTTDWKSKWFSTKNFAKFLHDDLKIKKYLEKKLAQAGLADLTIERSTGQITINIHTSRPGIIIGRGGQGIEELKKDISLHIPKQTKLNLNVVEIRQPDTVASIVAQNIATQIEKRIPYKRAIKQAIERALQSNAKGIKIMVKGRLNNVDIARQETFAKGKIPLHTIRADIDYSLKPAYTTNAGTIGVKVWIYKGEVFKKDLQKKSETPAVPPRPARPNRFRPRSQNSAPQSNHPRQTRSNSSPKPTS